MSARHLIRHQVYHRTQSITTENHTEENKTLIFT